MSKPRFGFGAQERLGTPLPRVRWACCIEQGPGWRAIRSRRHAGSTFLLKLAISRRKQIWPTWLRANEEDGAAPGVNLTAIFEGDYYQAWGQAREFPVPC